MKPMKLSLTLGALCLLAAAGCAQDKPLELAATQNARVFFHASEMNVNGGGVHRLRVCSLEMDSADVAILDFDRAALKAWLDKHAGKEVSAGLVLSIRAIEEGPARLQVAALDTASDWKQGDKNQKPAAKGEVCCGAAQFGVQPWTSADGKKVKNLRELVFSKDGVKTTLNPGGADVTDASKMQFVTIPLDAAFVRHVADDPNCKGVVVFTRTGKARVYFSSNDKEGHQPRLLLAVSDKKAQGVM
ncbi:MAG: hypothetical protein BIFFINMI_04362 [Phycisphaerae bacterium]|nr:hypothetical protein [Phycisphaerae bacterium]